MIIVICDTPVDEGKMKESIRNEFNQQKDDLRYGLRRMMTKMICLAALGIAILSLWLVLSVTTETVWVEILSIMGWVVVWEATSIAVMQRTELRLAQLNLEVLSKA